MGKPINVSIKPLPLSPEIMVAGSSETSLPFTKYMALHSRRRRRLIDLFYDAVSISYDITS
jgi:hypothetical protein